ncbi:hypothetical protein F511_24348 [Dorcoceras hygrometricum]|uniref:Uncharacterized protein n=1 Tax=Dorcoceras hygrometricum TaxID=472368 RepID=A0A2Z7D8B4_9LAMI|nr:hypothetical protein F511_24348 [Dorcoceras hygrometricum]
MFNNDPQQQNLYNITPRISFSNDFADQQQPIKLENIYREAPVSSDFEFSVPNNTMISADELFSKGKLLPTKKNGVKGGHTTLRDELLNGDDDFENVSSRIAKGTGRWKERLGLHRSNVTSKKIDKNMDRGLERIDELKTHEMTLENNVFKGVFN